MSMETNEVPMKILAVCSTIDFRNFVRRATLEEIWRQNPETDFLFFTGIKNRFKGKNIIEGPKFYSYHFWIPEKFKKKKKCSFIEYKLRGKRWRNFFKNYDIIFLSDPNQYYLLPYLNRQKVVYLLRDPNILLNKQNYFKEKQILERTDLILAISKNLAYYYLPKHYTNYTSNIKIWSNSVDLGLWNVNKLLPLRQGGNSPIIGLAGNLTFVNDMELLDYITDKRSGYNFRLAGEVRLEGEKQKIFNKLIKKKNVNHLGRIPLEEFPKEVINWTIGIVAGDRGQEYSKYLNNNKQYQYLALGKPFVTYNHNAEYDDFGGMVFVARDKEDFVKKIDNAIQRSGMKDCIEKGRYIAQRNSAKIRASEFLHYVSETCPVQSNTKNGE